MALGGLFGNVGGMASGVASGVEDIADTTGKSRNAAGNDAFHKDKDLSYFDTFTGSVTADREDVLARKTVPAGVELAWGYGRASASDNQGILYVDLQNSTPAAVDGNLIFAQETATGRFERYVAEYDTTRLQGSTTDRQQQVPFPEAVNYPTVKKDMDILLRLNPNSTDTVSLSDSTTILPITEYDLTRSQMGGV